MESFHTYSHKVSNNSTVLVLVQGDGFKFSLVFFVQIIRCVDPPRENALYPPRIYCHICNIYCCTVLVLVLVYILEQETVVCVLVRYTVFILIQYMIQCHANIALNHLSRWFDCTYDVFAHLNDQAKWLNPLGLWLSKAVEFVSQCNLSWWKNKNKISHKLLNPLHLWREFHA